MSGCPPVTLAVPGPPSDSRPSACAAAFQELCPFGYGAVPGPGDAREGEPRSRSHRTSPGPRVPAPTVTPPPATRLLQMWTSAPRTPASAVMASVSTPMAPSAASVPRATAWTPRGSAVWVSGPGSAAASLTDSHS